MDVRSAVTEYISGLKCVLDDLPVESIEQVVSRLHDAYVRDRQVFVAGNGGSAATASHMACDLSKTVLGSPPAASVRRFRVQALTDNVSLMTAWGNDVHYDCIFAEQIRGLARRGDVLLVISGSGNSANIIQAVRTARDLGLSTIGLLGFDGGRVRGMLDHSVTVESEDYGFIEDAHMVLVHLVTAYLKKRLGRGVEGSRRFAVSGGGR